MIFQEPKVKFVSIDLKNVIATSGCPDYESQTPTGGGQYCTGTEPNAKYCPEWEGDCDWG